MSTRVSETFKESEVMNESFNACFEIDRDVLAEIA